VLFGPDYPQRPLANPGAAPRISVTYLRGSPREIAQGQQGGPPKRPI